MEQIRKVYGPSNEGGAEQKAQRRRYGFIYGLAAGLAFSFAAWGPDTWELAGAHAVLPWIKLVIGTPIAVIIGALAGWLTARSEKAAFGLIAWILAAVALAWFSAYLPLQMISRVMMRLDPSLVGRLDYPIYNDFQVRAGLLGFWIAIGGALVGVMQLPMSEQTIFSTALLPRITPLLVCATIMLIVGAFSDNFNHQPLRDPLIVVDQLVGFARDHAGQKVDAKAAREAHLGALGQTAAEVGKPYRLVLGTYTSVLDQVHVLVDFDGTWVDCFVVYLQPSYCRYVSP